MVQSWADHENIPRVTLEYMESSIHGLCSGFSGQ